MIKTSLPSISIKTVVETPENWKGAVLLLPIFKDALPSPIKDLDRRLKGAIRAQADEDRFEADAEKIHWIDLPNVAAKRVLLVSLGSRKEASRDTIRNGYGNAAKALLDRQVESVGLAWIDEKSLVSDFDAALEGLLLGSYQFDRYRKEASQKKKIKNVSILGKDRKILGKVEKELGRIKTYAEATAFARDLVNEPPNIATPTYMTKMAQAVAKDQNLKLDVLNEAKLKSLGMDLILAVGMGSSERPRMVHLEYRPKGKVTKKVALVGKGVTFDSGGLSLKPQSAMYGMKCDMSGSAAVLAAAWAVAKLKLPVHLHVLIPLVENIPSALSSKPGDVFYAANGKSVEIENTDAEGRLILADALCYTKKLKVDTVIDIATLTGAVMVALGADIAGTMGNDASLIGQIDEASKRAGEKFWELPMEKSYHRLLKSDVADVKNVGGRYGGSITAGLFLSEFVDDDQAWAHLDIAGPAFIERDWPVSPKGGTGFAVRTFLEFLSGKAK